MLLGASAWLTRVFVARLWAKLQADTGGVLPDVTFAAEPAAEYAVPA